VFLFRFFPIHSQLVMKSLEHTFKTEKQGVLKRDLLQ